MHLSTMLWFEDKKSVWHTMGVLIYIDVPTIPEWSGVFFLGGGGGSCHFWYIVMLNLFW